ncbi:SDR family NAD(P)-dependent oxidoreductase [Burkholderia sp. F1]|uniref:SDR family NAD(P)-dependent oxidoreductase n=1 Tax=Burkholderia sp. F1 TaxID=3366817 RepID=UPI003D70C8DA
MAARLPGANDYEQFWENLKNVVDSVREIPPGRWDVERYYSPVSQDLNKSVSKWGGFIDGVDWFDPMFFGISPREARVMDPQQRILLELAWACLEDAGHAQDALRGSRTGVFVGVMNFDYRERLTDAIGAIAGHMSTGAYTALIPNRLSYYFDWHGPSVPIDTACSSSLVALHHAVRALQLGECEQALAGGVSVLCSPTHYVSFSKTGMLSPDGRCRSFDERANGYVRGEGAGLLLLKPLSRARADGDRIHGVIRGTAVNHGGKVRTVTYPNPDAQADVIATAHERAGVPPDTIGYIEAHGTGTPKGDPIEISGLNAAFARLAAHYGCRLAPQSCGLGSLKANVGHLEPVAGVAGVIKVLLAMRHRTLPGLAHFQQLNHRIDLSAGPLHIVESTRDWPALRDGDGQPLPRRAGVSSFGFGGVNAHAVIEEFVDDGADLTPPDAARAGLGELVVLSARTSERLRAQAAQLLEWLSRPAQQAVALADLAYTLQVGRSAMAHRLALSVHSLDELRRTLAAWCAGEHGLDGVHAGEVREDDGVLAALGAQGGAGLVDGLVAGGQRAKLLELWTLGLTVDWGRLYGAHRPRRIGLPTYPFARESHWVAAPGAAASGATGDGAHGAADAARPEAASSSAVPAGPERAPLYFEEHWVEQAPPPAGGREINTVLCFASHAATRRAIADHFGALARPVRVVFVSDAATGHTLDTEPVTRDDPASFRAAFERIQARHGKVDAALYLWAVEDARHLADCTPIVSLLQAAGATRLIAGPILLAAQGDAAGQRCHWESWLGFERSAGQALAGTPVAALYRVAARPPDAADLAEWARTLDAALRAEHIESCVHEDASRQVCRLRAVDPASAAAAPPLRRGGVYLITGGLGGLGRHFADYLLRHWAATVVLVGRTPVDAARQGLLDALAGRGGQLLYLPADVTDHEQMAACLATVKARFGILNGVFHAAGVECWEGLQTIRRETFARVLAPKVAGTLVLDQLLRDEPLDVFCSFSSVAAIVGDFGACAYAVGNRFQMAHARVRQARRAPGRTLAISWPLWRDGGMQVGDAQSTRFYLQSTGQRLLETDEGMTAFERLSAGTGSHGLVMVGEPERIRRLLGLEANGERPAAAAHAVAEDAGGAPPADDTPLQSRVEQDLLRVAGELLQVAADRLALDRNFADFGFDSINLASFATMLTSRYGVELLPAVFFSYPTLERLAQFLVEQHGPALHLFHRRAAHAAPDTPLTPDTAPASSSAQVEAPADSLADDAIAVIGMSARCAGASDIDEMWRILSEGRSAVAAVPPDREGGWAGFAPHAGFMARISTFDSLFFEISPREADDMDPRQRLLLEETWKALEDAGYGPAQLAAGSVGVFAGVEAGDYDRLARAPEDGDAPITSNHNGILAGRLAYFLNLEGPALAVNTACSSGLVVFHQACQSLRAGECDTAIVASANLLITPRGHRQMDDAGMLSPGGRCRAFDADADGMVPGEAVVALVLKRAAYARRDGDRLLALVAGSGINADGRTNGITAPNGAAQARLIESIYRRHRIDPAQLDWVVAHGTGTKLGDPVEVNALSDAFRRFTARTGFCALSSIKPNFGHALAASGLLSVVALIEAMRRGTIPASLNWAQPNPYIAWRDAPFFVNAANRPWPRRRAGARMGAVSAFGMSGTNAHVVLRECVAQEDAHGNARAPAAQPAYLFVLSAKTEKALRERRADLARYFESREGGGDLADLAYTLLDRRHHFAYRRAVVAGSAAEAALLLRQDESGCQQKVARDFRPQAAEQRRVDALLDACASLGGDAARWRAVLAELADLYCRGYAPPAARVLSGARPRLTSLPSYPFAPVRHWVRAADADAAMPTRDVVAIHAAPDDARIPAAASAATVEPDAMLARATDAGVERVGETVLLAPVWDRVEPRVGALAAQGGRVLAVGLSDAAWQAARTIDPRAVCVPPDAIDSEAVLMRVLDAPGPIDQVIWQAPPVDAAPNGQASAADERGLLACFRLIQALLARGYGARALGFTALTVRAQSIGAGDPVDAAQAGVHGLIGSLAKERPNWKIRLVDLPAPDAVPLADLLALPADRRGHAWVHRYGEWYRRHLAPVRPGASGTAPYRRRGVYIVIGGAGDIGAAWSEYLVRRYDARIVWVGRREPDADLEARRARLAALGEPPLYLRADAGRPDTLQAVRRAVLERHGEIHGVVHAAMVFGNQALAGMTEAQFLAVLRAKTETSVSLMRAFGADALDFLLLFSSMISLIKNPLQAHYAAGCTFKDAFAQQLARHVSFPVKVVNWGYWAQHKNAGAEVRVLTELGLGLIEPDDGMAALDVLLGASLNQLGVMRLAKDLEIEGMDARETIELYPPVAALDAVD